MNTPGVEKGLEKESKAVVQSDRVSGVTTDSSAKTIGQSEPGLAMGVWIVSYSSYSFHPILLLLLLYIGLALLMCWVWL